MWTLHGLQRMMCGLRGHDAVLSIERNRLSLRCLSCGHETAGWMLSRKPVTRTRRLTISRSAIRARHGDARFSTRVATPMNRQHLGAAPKAS